MTNPRRVTPPKTAEEALQAIEQFLALPGLTLLPLPADVVTRWIALVRARPVRGGEVFDVQAAAAMLGHGLGTVFTYNGARRNRNGLSPPEEFSFLDGIIAIASLG